MIWIFSSLRHAQWRVPRALLGLAIALAALASPRIASAADSDPPAFVVFLADGKNAIAVADAGKSQLPKPWQSKSGAEVEPARKPAGVPAKLGPAFKNKDRKDITAKLVKLGEALKAKAVFVAVDEPGKEPAVRVVLVDVEKKTLRLDESIPAAKAKTQITDTLSPALSDIVPEPKAAPPPETPKPDVAEKKPEEAPKKEDDTGRRDRIVAVTVGAVFGGRFVSYNDKITSNLRPYDVFGAPGPFISAEAYPFVSMGALKNLGVVGGFRFAVGLDSKGLSGDKRISTSWNRIDAGLRYRIPIGQTRDAGLGVLVAYGRESFTYDDPSEEIPGVTYGFLRLAVDGRLPAGPVALLARGAFLPVLAKGDMGNRLRGTSVAGIEAEAGLAIPLSRAIEIVATGAYTRFFYSFAPEPGDRFIAGGALDQFVRISGGASFAY